MEQVSTYPDIIVHRRGTNDHNTLIIELKKDSNRSDWNIDEVKLEGFTRSRDNEGYGYTVGVHLVVHTGKPWKQPEFTWYQQGSRCGAE